MTIVPIFNSPCDLARRIPAMVSEFLDIERSIRRRFREDSISDIIIASLLKVGESNATVIVPYEPVTGSDFDILIIDPVSSEAIQYRIQAKRMFPHPVKWTMGCYRELAHPLGTGKQASTLVRSSAHEKIRTIPLYAFYNPETACRASEGMISGIELASGLEINRLVKAIVKAKPKRLPFKRVGYLQNLFFPLSTILCPSDVALVPPRKILSPRQSRDAVESAIVIRARNVSESVPESVPLEIESITRLPPADSRSISQDATVFTLNAELPVLIRRAVEQRGEKRSIRASIRRPKILLISEVNSS